MHVVYLLTFHLSGGDDTVVCTVVIHVQNYNEIAHVCMWLQARQITEEQKVPRVGYPALRAYIPTFMCAILG